MGRKSRNLKIIMKKLPEKNFIKKLYKCGKIVYYVSIKINSNAEAGKGADKRCIVCFFCC